MMIAYPLTILALISATLARNCANRVPPESRIAMYNDFSAKRVRVVPTADASIDVHFHIIQKGESPSDGHVPEGQIVDQMSVLNDAFSGSGLTFDLATANYITEEAWFSKASPDDDGLPYQNEMKKYLRVGGPATLNVYTVGFEKGEASKGLAGYATFPQEYENAPLDDGVVIRYTTLPGGPSPPFNLGGTLQHEVGHWVGLLHTFNEGELEGTCTESSDKVPDTPMERSASYGCERGRNTCPGYVGEDPIHNYMDYSDDECYEEFTLGQIDRFTDMMATYRGVQF